MAEASIGAGYPRALVGFAASKGADRAALLSVAGLSEADFAAQDNRISLAAYVTLLDAAAELTGEPAIALQFGEAVRMQEISIVGLICEACETTMEVGAQLNRYASLVIDDGGAEPATMMRGVAKDGGIWIEGLQETLMRYPRIVEAEFARLVWNTRIMFAGSAEFARMRFPAVIHFGHADPGYRDEYERVFQAPVVFDSHWNAMLVDAGFPFLKQPPVNRYVFGVLSERADKLLAELKAAKSVRARLEALLMPILHTGAISMERVAADLGMSQQSLYRALRAEGVTYERVLDELRRELARHFLESKRVSVNETAYLLGFSDPASFSRAFRRWTGNSPGSFRTKTASLTESQVALKGATPK